MGRALREWEPGDDYHLTPTGNDGRPIFCDDVDRVKLVELTTSVFAAYEVTVFGYCLMTTHIHFVVRSGVAGLTPAMRDLFGRYTRYSNRRRGRRGHLFTNRCHVEHIETEAHLKAALAYVDLNPVRAGLVQHAEDWPWSSYRAHVGLERPRPLLANDEFLLMFGHVPDVAREVYRKYVLSWKDAALQAVSDTLRVSDTGY